MPRPTAESLEDATVIYSHGIPYYQDKVREAFKACTHGQITRIQLAQLLIKVAGDVAARPNSDEPLFTDEDQIHGYID